MVKQRKPIIKAQVLLVKKYYGNQLQGLFSITQFYGMNLPMVTGFS